MPWYAKDCHYLEDPKIMRLGDRFGPAGPIVIDRLMARAKLTGQGGRMECAYRTLALECFIESPGQVSEIIAVAIELGILTELVEDGFSFAAAFPKATWERWQANFRQQQKRDRDRLENGDITPSHEPSRKVTKQDRTGQDRTGQDKTGQDTPQPPEGGSDDVFEIFGYWQQKLGKHSSKLTTDRRRRIAARLKEGYTVDDIKAAIDGVAGSRWHRGENDRKREFVDFDLICRSGSKLEGFRDMARKGGAAPPPTFAVGTSEAERLWKGALDDLEPSISAPAFEALAESVKPLGVHNGVLHLSASEREANWIERRYRPRIEAAVGGRVEVAA